MPHETAAVQLIVTPSPPQASLSIAEVAPMNDGGSAHPRDIKLGLISIQDYMGAAGRTAFNDQGDVIRYPRMFIIKQGVAIPYDKFVEDGGSLFKQN